MFSSNSIHTRIYVSIGALLFILAVCVFWYFESGARNQEVRIGYFHGGRVHGLYRANVNELSNHLGNQTTYFDEEGIDLKLYSKYLLEDGWYEVPKKHEEMEKIAHGSNDKPSFGKATGIEIIEAIEDGVVDGGTPGESSFVQMVTEGSPVVAVAMLGHEPKDEPGKVLVLRDDVVINSSKDFKGKTYGSRRAGPGDYIFLAEFFESIGLNPRKDVTLLPQIPDDLQLKYLRDNITQGHLSHLHSGIDAEIEGIGYVYQAMNWINPELSFAVLVFHKKYIEEHPDRVKKVIRGYMKRLKYEATLSYEERVNPLGCQQSPGERWWHSCFGIKVEEQTEGVGYAVYDYPPLVRIDLLEEIQSLLLKYDFINTSVDIKDFVNNSFVESVYNELEIGN